MRRVTSAGRAAACAAMAAAVAAILTGCLPVNGPIAIGTLNGHFRVAVCEELIVNEAYASVREHGEDLKLMWEADGQVTIPAGTAVSLAEDSFGMSVAIYAQPRFEPGDRLQFTFLGHPDASTGTLAYFTVPEGGVGDGLWLTPDGDIEKSPCG